MNPRPAHFDALSEEWLDGMWQASWKGTIAIVLAGLVCRVFPSLPAKVKCWLWRLVLLQMLAAFLWTAPVRLPVLPAAEAGRPPELILRSSETARPRPDVARPPSQGLNSTFEISTIPAVRSEAGKGQSRSFFSHPSVPNALFALWSAGAFLFLIRLIGDWRSARRLNTASAPLVENALLACRGRQCERMGIAPVPELRVSDEIKSPLLAGALQPRIFFPSVEMSKRPSAELELMLAHELAHVRRRDLWWCWLPAVSRLLFFFNPFTWLAHREYGLAQEIACDELAISAANSSPADYGKMLLEFATKPGRVSPAGVIAAGIFESKRNLERRLIAMKTTGAFSNKGIILVTIAAVMIAGAGIVPWKLVAQQDAPKEKTEPNVSESGGKGNSARELFFKNPWKTALTDSVGVTPTELSTDVPNPDLAKNLQTQKGLYEEEIKMVETLLKYAKAQGDAGIGSQDTLIDLKKELLSLRREIARLNSDAKEWNELVREEMNLIEQQIAATQFSVEAGRASASDVIRLRRELLNLKRESAAATPGSPSLKEASHAASEEVPPTDGPNRIARPIRLSAPVSGTIAQLFVKAGDPVKKGAKLAQLDNRSARSNLEETFARLEMARANVRLATLEVEHSDRTLKRREQLAEGALVSEEEISLARYEKQVASTNLEKAEAELRLAEVQVDRAKIALEELTIRAPIDGTVAAIFAAEGERVSDLLGELILILTSEIDDTARP